MYISLIFTRMDLHAMFKNMSVKSIVLLSGLTIVVMTVVWSVMGYSQSSVGLSESVASLSARNFGVPSAPMMDSNFYRMKVEGVAYDAVSEDRREMIAPPSPGSNAPAGVSKIIKNGDLTLLVRNVDDAAAAIVSLRINLGGQPGNASFSEYGNGGKQGDITIWVPSDKFDGAMVSIKKLALRVNSERITVQDVSAQFVDLESRLRNLKVAEAQYQEIMKRSGKISEVLDVTRALTDTRAQIEQSQGQLDYLSRQVALSSIHVSLTQEAVPGSVIASNEWRPMTVVKAALSRTLSDFTHSIDQILVILISLPLLLLNLAFWGAVLYACWRVGRFLFRRLKGQALP